ncbi:hypothetical protein GDO81_023666 [Engystomops pustulosus]|uniref:Secreted protein n=1 Tax=Engystomops pustulosus TaxID=76066 RepID=A0AAV6YRL6_ENGPU|nr:hypothetical protein GDO81_023666 [Engystomops pustulosus]
MFFLAPTVALISVVVSDHYNPLHCQRRGTGAEEEGVCYANLLLYSSSPLLQHLLSDSREEFNSQILGLISQQHSCMFTTTCKRW